MGSVKHLSKGPIEVKKEKREEENKLSWNFIPPSNDKGIKRRPKKAGPTNVDEDNHTPNRIDVSVRINARLVDGVNEISIVRNLDYLVKDMNIEAD